MPPVNTIDLLDLIPDVNLRDDESGDLERFINEVLQPVLDLLIEEDLERFARQNNPDEADENVVDAMLADLGSPFDVALSQPLVRRRALVRLLIPIYLGKGTASSLQDVVRTLTGIEAVVVFPATIDAWVLGVDVLGPGTPPVDEDFTNWAVLGPDPDFMRYSFQIDVPRILTDDEKETVTEIVSLVKPAHTHFEGFLEPGSTAPVDDWELDVSELGIDSDLH